MNPMKSNHVQARTVSHGCSNAMTADAFIQRGDVMVIRIALKETTK